VAGPELAGRLRWLAPITLGLLFALTVGAFGLSQRLKREPLVIDRVEYIAEGIGPFAPKRSVFSPNGDCRRDRMLIRFRTTKSDNADVEVIGPGKTRIRLLEEDRFFKRYREHELVWDGRKDNGNVPQTNAFRVRVTMRGLDRELILPGKIRLHRFRAVGSACPDGRIRRGSGGIGPGQQQGAGPDQRQGTDPERQGGGAG
jgi:hypothetical protein